MQYSYEKLNCSVGGKDYLNITEPSALYLLKDILGDGVENKGNGLEQGNSCCCYRYW